MQRQVELDSRPNVSTLQSSGLVSFTKGDLLQICSDRWVNPRSKILNPGSGIWNPRSGIRGVECGIQGVESGIQGVESGIQGVESGIQGVESEIRGVESGIQGVESEIQKPPEQPHFGVGRYPVQTNTAVKRNAHVRDLRKRGKNKGKLYTKECGLNKNTKYKKTPENIR